MKKLIKFAVASLSVKDFSKMRSLSMIIGVCLFSVSVHSQTSLWGTEGNNISNLNTGTVLIRTPSNYVGATRFAIVPSPADGVRMTIGEPNIGSGGYTSLNFEISTYQNGFGTIQAIKSAGSAYGVLALNPGGGSVGIGTSTPGNYKLAVEGLIGAREIKVTTAAWADYVFASDYKLLSLRDLEAYIKKNNHLPNIPSAQEVKENKGVELGAMNVKLLEKIEELTLHLIEVNKRLEVLEKEKSNAKSNQE